MPWAFSDENRSTWALIKKSCRNSNSGPKKLAFSAFRRFPAFLPSSQTKEGFEVFLEKTGKKKIPHDVKLLFLVWGPFLPSRGTLKSIFAHRADFGNFAQKIIMADSSGFLQKIYPKT